MTDTRTDELEFSSRLDSVRERHPSRVRILKFVNNFFIGGTERQFVHVANGLDRSRFAVNIACLSREGPLVETLKPDMPVYTYPLGGSLFSYRSMLSQFRLLREVRKRQFHIVHTYGWYPNVFAIPASRLAFRPVIIASIRDAGAYMTPAKIKALKFVCNLADCVLANSNAGRTWLVEQGVKEQKVEVIRNGIVVPPRAERRSGPGLLHKEFGIPVGTPICACIGRVVSGKGIEYYLRAARILADCGRDVRFVLIGARSVQRNYQSEIEKLTDELNIRDRVIFAGQRQDVTELLREVDIVVHPSLTEGLSNVILESMAAAVPVVATQVGGNPELVEDGRTGLLIPAENAGAIADAICSLLDQPEMARAFGARARQRVIDEFVIDRMLSRTEALYLRLIERRLALAHGKRIHFEDHESNPFLN
jgi:glycosyltransferase involved in cell wall biosynthesis